MKGVAENSCFDGGGCAVDALLPAKIFNLNFDPADEIVIGLLLLFCALELNEISLVSWEMNM